MHYSLFFFFFFCVCIYCKMSRSVVCKNASLFVYKTYMKVRIAKFYYQFWTIGLPLGLSMSSWISIYKHSNEEECKEAPPLPGWINSGVFFWSLWGHYLCMSFLEVNKTSSHFDNQLLLLFLFTLNKFIIFANFSFLGSSYNFSFQMKVFLFVPFLQNFLRGQSWNAIK